MFCLLLLLQHLFASSVYISSSFHLVRKNNRKSCFPRTLTVSRKEQFSFEENCEFRGTDNVQEQILVHFFKVEWRLFSLLSLSFSIPCPYLLRKDKGYKLRVIYRQGECDIERRDGRRNIFLIKYNRWLVFQAGQKLRLKKSITSP